MEYVVDTTGYVQTIAAVGFLLRSACMQRCGMPMPRERASESINARITRRGGVDGEDQWQRPRPGG